MNILETYQSLCKLHNIEFETINSFKSYDESTLFCPSGMQQFKKDFENETVVKTISNLQSCLRLNDLEEIGDGTHLLHFKMLGLFSFRQKSVEWTIDFFMTFLKEVSCLPDYVTIHPDKMTDWFKYYYKHNVEIRPDESCTWSDGNIGGYCTEFYKNNIEIGNIVNPLGTCIDVGFGLERLEFLINNVQIKTEDEVLIETVNSLIEEGYRPSNLKQGYVLRKLLRKIWSKGLKIEHEFFQQEIDRQIKILEKYNRLKDRFKDMPKEWWYSTHGINLDEVNI